MGKKTVKKKKTGLRCVYPSLIFCYCKSIALELRLLLNEGVLLSQARGEHEVQMKQHERDQSMQKGKEIC